MDRSTALLLLIIYLVVVIVGWALSHKYSHKWPKYISDPTGAIYRNTFKKWWNSVPDTNENEFLSIHSSWPRALLEIVGGIIAILTMTLLFWAFVVMTPLMYLGVLTFETGLISYLLLMGIIFWYMKQHDDDL